MKKSFFLMTITVFLLLCSSSIQAQDPAHDLDQLKLAQKYWVGTWQSINNDTTYVWEYKQDGNAILETDYIIVKGEKSVHSFWSYSYKPERNNFYVFAAYVKGGCDTGIGSFTDENKWCHKGYTMFNTEKYLGKVEFVFDTPTSCTFIAFTPEGTKIWEGKATKVK